MKNVIIKAGMLFFSLSFFSAAQADTAATDKKSAEEYDVLQSMIIKNESQLLPIRFDVYTLLTEVTR